MVASEKVGRVMFSNGRSIYQFLTINSALMPADGKKNYMGANTNGRKQK